MFDMEVLRNLELIEEREIYENNFISIEDIMKSDEMDYYTCPKFEEYFLNDIVCEDTMEEFDLQFDFEDYYVQLRDEQLIEERETYELEYFSLPDEVLKSDLMDLQIDSYEKYNYCSEYDYYEDAFPNYDYNEECNFDYDYYDDFYVEEIPMDAAYCGGRLFGYVVGDNEGFEEFDYPEGPDENLEGLRFMEPCYPVDFYDYSDPCLEFPDDFYDCPEPDYIMDDPMGLYLYENEESQMQKLIEQHLKEEKQFMKFLADEELSEDYFPPEIGDMMIILN